VRQSFTSQRFTGTADKRVTSVVRGAERYAARNDRTKDPLCANEWMCSLKFISDLNLPVIGFVVRMVSLVDAA